MFLVYERTVMFFNFFCGQECIFLFNVYILFPNLSVPKRLRILFLKLSCLGVDFVCDGYSRGGARGRYS